MNDKPRLTASEAFHRLDLSEGQKENRLIKRGDTIEMENWHNINFYCGIINSIVYTNGNRFCIPGRTSSVL